MWPCASFKQKASRISNDLYCFTPKRVFHSIVNWWFFSEVKVRATILKSLGVGLFVLCYVVPTICGGSLLKGKWYKRLRQKNIYNKTIYIIIMSRYQRGSTWPSLVTPPYYSLLQAGPQDYIPYRHRTTGRPAFAYPRERVHWNTSLMSSSLLLQQCPACLVRLILILFVMGGWWPYSCCFVGGCLQDLFNIFV